MDLIRKPRKLGEEVNPHDHTIDHNWISVLDKGFVRLVDSMGDDSSIVQAARISYGKGTKTVSDDEGLIRYLMRNKHTTPFEMVQIKMHIKAPIFVLRQWHRHRMWSYNEISGRYSEMKDEFYVPDTENVTAQNQHNKQGGTNDLIHFDCHNKNGNLAIWGDQFELEQSDIRKNYEYYLSTGMRKELARINLPLSQYSEMYASVDLHNLFHFLKLRLDSHAQYEIRVYAEAIAEIVKSIVPVAYKAFEDYVLNSINLTQKDIEGIKVILKKLNEEESAKEIENLFQNKRERQEFISKMNKIFQ